MPKITIVYYTVHGHTRTLALAIQKGIESMGGKADLYQIPETLPPNIELPPKPDDPVITIDILKQYDGILCGSPTYFGAVAAQWRVFWDSTIDLWEDAELSDKYVGMFTSTGTIGGGQETTAFSSIPMFVHHGMIFVSLGYKYSMKQVCDMGEIHGGTPWGAGTYSGNDHDREPTKIELEIAHIQGQRFFKTVARAYP